MPKKTIRSMLLRNRLSMIKEDRICPECRNKLERIIYKNKSVLWCNTCNLPKYFI